MSDSRLAEVLHTLIDGWCARRALRPLAAVLPAYVAFNGLTDGWQDLWRAVNDLRALPPAELTDAEQAAVAEARLLIREAFAAVDRQAELR